MELADPVVLAVPRGGIIVGDEIAKGLGCDLDVVISKKITPPGEPEYAIGAVTGDGTIYRSRSWDLYKDHPRIQEEIEEKRREVARRVLSYRKSMDYALKERDVILCDDGVATGSTIMAILQWLPTRHPRRIVLAVPVMPKDMMSVIPVSDVVSLNTPSTFSSVGQFYNDFGQVEDLQVRDILRTYRE